MTKTIESNVPVRPVFDVPGGMTRWNPAEELPLLRHRMEDLFSRAFGYTPLSRLLPEPILYEPAVDIYEKTDVVELFAALPGFTVDMIKVEATPEYIVINGERKPLYEDKVPPIFRQGFVTTPWTFTVNFALPCEIDPNGVKAVFSNGVLHITMRKSEKALVRNIEVPVTPV